MSAKFVSNVSSPYGQAAASYAQVQPNADGGGQVAVTVTLKEPPIRQKLPDFDGMLKPFALIPKADGSFDRVALTRRAPADFGALDDGVYNVYSEGVTVDRERLQSIEDQGIAVGIETNKGTLMMNSAEGKIAPDVEQTAGQVPRPAEAR